jgi:hypothetical protein
MIQFPKLVLLVLVAVAVWYAMRWLNRPAQKVARQREGASPRATPAVEDLTACRVCGAYVAAGAPACGKPGCPLLT